MASSVGWHQLGGGGCRRVAAAARHRASLACRSSTATSSPSSFPRRGTRALLSIRSLRAAQVHTRWQGSRCRRRRCRRCCRRIGCPPPLLLLPSPFPPSPAYARAAAAAPGLYIVWGIAVACRCTVPETLCREINCACMRSALGVDMCAGRSAPPVRAIPARLACRIFAFSLCGPITDNNCTVVK